MSFLFYATNLLLLISFVVFVRQMVQAPEGYEDAKGFHFGAQGAEAAARRVRVFPPKKSVAAFAKVSGRHVVA